MLQPFTPCLPQLPPSSPPLLQEVRIHPYYDPVFFANDIALLVLQRPCFLKGSIAGGQFVSLAPAQVPSATEAALTGKRLTVVGFGHTNTSPNVASRVLQ